MKYYELKGYYGSGKTPCTVLVAETRNGVKWYVVEGSQNVNATYDDIDSGVNVETLSDVDVFTSSAPIETLDDLEFELTT